jgi:D-alanine transaminase
MTRIAYVNGRYVPYHRACVHVEDRGFQFADAVYEVIEIRSGGLVDEDRHLARLARSLAELQIPEPMSDAALRHVIRQTIRHNRVNNGTVYLQVTRGAAPRDFSLPEKPLAPTLVCLARRSEGAKIAAAASTGISVITTPDIRWQRCDIKTVMLLPAVLAKEQARKQGAKEAWLLDREGYVTEGASSNAWIVTKSQEVITRKLDNAILPGVTRRTLIDLLKREGLTFLERPFTRSEALNAAEAFTTSASGTVMPVVRLDGIPIGNGSPGPLTRRLRAEFHSAAQLGII